MVPGCGHIKGTDVLQRDDDELLTTVVDGELVALSVEQGACYGFNAIGTRIWELLAEPRSVDSLWGQLAGEYAVEEALHRQEVLDFLEELRKEGIVSVSSGR